MAFSQIRRLPLSCSQTAFWANQRVLSTGRPCSALKSITANEHAIQKEEFFAKNERLQRPTSPHLTIYKFQMTSMLSITHRATGLVQSGLLGGFAVGTMILPGTFPQFLDTLTQAHFGPALIFAAKFALAWPFAYHLLNGVRHLSWDMGYGFQMPDLYKTGYAVLALSVVVGGALAAM
ncbi:hypothetical protein TCAL_04388 [Tigriopus californicus]|uniref:Uncharacterized protein n=1 Tax=Tigriopus californicus TaxID=6832 RepID=A0A553N7Q2_TIGCA|nr:succinate dehydrogenase cytochrome b560 subunit, mitochondrial-like [Tigriopus californicus]TRY61474.1 hypothetical protein TCAL_04388 [Tigriopus californicus]|eukprot:TCALIF_04388-PA protein Name:"Similar to SDHC Succinate dehydrogenase cytochrome b560 subunit, mitochondrial (Cricetulus griseus)" AED:0.10 eAED:0.10 QI:39/1/1/1/0.5/0.6/5/100/177